VAGAPRPAAEQIVRYLAAARTALGRLPTLTDLVVERFFDETGGQQLVIHAPLGGRINRALGLTVRKRICRSFDFELQAAASDDAVVLSLGPQHSFPLADFVQMLRSQAVPETLAQAALLSPMFKARWRWNLGRSRAVRRLKCGRRNPPPIQRMEADDLMAAVFPGLAQCQENATGPIEIPDHPIVRQTVGDCLREAMDAEGLVTLLEAIEAGGVRVHVCDTTEPSPLCHEILNGKPFTFLDDAPLEERRTRAVALRRGLPEDVRDLAKLDPDAIARVRDEAGLAPRDAEELHDALQALIVLRPEPALAAWHEALARDGRAALAQGAQGPLWLAAECLPFVVALFPGARIVPELRLPEALAAARPDPDAAATAALRGHLDLLGPTTQAELAAATGLAPNLLELALARLEAEGFCLRGRFDESLPGEQLCARRLLARIHAYTQERLRREIEPVSAQDFLRFLLRWQHVAPGTRREGRRGLLAVVEQLQGFEAGAGAWEQALLPARVDGYRPEWLDGLCLSGDVMWGRMGIRTPAVVDCAEEAGRGGAVPSRATPLALAVREDLPWLLAAARGEQCPALPGPGAARDVLDALARRGALFQAELAAETGRLPLEVEQGLWDLVSRGLVSADGFGAVRALLAARERPERGRSHPRRGLRRGALGTRPSGGRWARLVPPAQGFERDALAEAVALQLVARWGVVFRDLLARETLALAWREIQWALRRLEARGTLRGGRFVTGFSGEQYALPGAV
jgi:ATP-dependent Lhr-like helicase